MRWAVVMAGGNGTRFWPLSNPSHPKQFLTLLGAASPAKSCLDRLARVVDRSRILIVSSTCHRQALAQALPDFPEDQVLWEPAGRNTAPCIAWACETILARDPEALIGVFPSDHAISDVEAFAKSLERAFEAAPGRIVLFGIEPTRPETGYGYIEEGSLLSENLHTVASFLEKPDLETAQSYLAAGRYLWNSGMFIFDARTMHGELTRHVPQIMDIIRGIVDHPETLDTEFKKLLSISIDYAVMEHTDCAVVMRASFPWDDLGTWDSVSRYFPNDKDENASHGDVTMLDCRKTFAYAGDARPIAVLGLENVIVVSTPDATLVMDASRAQDVRKIVEARQTSRDEKCPD